MALWRSLRNFCIWAVAIWLVSVSANSGFRSDQYVDISKSAQPAFLDVTIVAAGDLISHQDVQQAALSADNGWASLWTEITPLFIGADLAMLNLETPIAPITGKPGVPFCFNAPADLARALKETGVDLVFAANNHAFDQNVKGVVETIEHLEANGVLFAGSGLTRHDAESPVVIELRGGIKVGVLARTDIFNNCLNQRPDRPWVAALDMDNDERIIRELHGKVDALIISIHWGNEYQTRPTAHQREVATRLIAAGVDIIVGHHPHVLQPSEWIESGGRKGVVAFSLGNFLSNQNRMYDPATQQLSAGDSRDGGLLILTLRKDASGIKLHDAHVEPIWTDNNYHAYTKRQDTKRVIRILRTTPGERGDDMESLLSKRRAHALKIVAGY